MEVRNKVKRCDNFILNGGFKLPLSLQQMHFRVVHTHIFEVYLCISAAANADTLKIRKPNTTQNF